MFRTQTTFVLGAGASCEFGFPSGQTLLSEISNKLDFYIDGSVTSGCPRLWEWFNRLSQKECLDIGEIWKLAKRLSTASKVNRSIDNVIDQNDDDPLIPRIAKIAIASCILDAERNSKLAINLQNPLDLSFDNLADTWFIPFAQMLTTDVRKSQIETIFDKISIVTFNYDRSFERLVPYILQCAYGMNLNEAQSIVEEKLRIYHPYGRVGSLRKALGSGTSVAFGGDADLIEISKNIVTFTERAGTDQVHSIQETVSETETLVFLGFGFHIQNMNILSPPQGSVVRKIYSTYYKEPDSFYEIVSSRISNMLGRCSDGPEKIHMVNHSCGQMLKDNFHQITS